MRRTNEEIIEALQREMDNIPKALDDIQLELAKIQEELGPMEKGDMRENAGLNDLRERQANTNMRLLQLERKKEAWENFKYDQESQYVQEGTFIYILDVANREEYNFVIVPKELGNSLIGALSITTPVAKALLGKEQGAQVIVPSVEGELIYVLKEVN